MTVLLTRIRQQVTIRGRTVVGGVALAVVLLGALMFLGPPAPERVGPPPERVGPLTAVQPEVRQEARQEAQPAREDLPPEPATPAPEIHPGAPPVSPAPPVLEPPEPHELPVPAPAGEAADLQRLCRTLAEAWAELRALLEATPLPGTPLPGDLGEVPPDLPCSDWNGS